MGAAIPVAGAPHEAAVDDHPDADREQVSATFVARMIRRVGPGWNTARCRSSEGRHEAAAPARGGREALFPPARSRPCPAERPGCHPRCHEAAQGAEHPDSSLVGDGTGSAPDGGESPAGEVVRLPSGARRREIQRCGRRRGWRSSPAGRDSADRRVIPNAQGQEQVEVHPARGTRRTPDCGTTRGDRPPPIAAPPRA